MRRGDKWTCRLLVLARALALTRFSDLDSRRFADTGLPEIRAFLQ